MITTAGNGKKTKPMPTSTRRIPIAAAKNKQAVSVDEFNLKVAQQAYQIFESRGFVHGYDIQDWFDAQRIVSQSYTTTT